MQRGHRGWLRVYKDDDGDDGTYVRLRRIANALKRFAMETYKRRIENIQTKSIYKQKYVHVWYIR